MKITYCEPKVSIIVSFDAWTMGSSHAWARTPPPP